MCKRRARLWWVTAFVMACGGRSTAPPSAAIAPVASRDADTSLGGPLADGGISGASAPSCEGVADRVVARAFPLSEAVDRCKPSDIVLAVLRATVHPSHDGFVAEDGHGEGIVRDSDRDFPPPAHVSWRGTCLARLHETLAASDRVPPVSCLEEATIREQEQPQPAEETRAAFLSQNASVAERWATCRKRGQPEACLDNLLPLSGAGRKQEDHTAAWIAARDAPPEPAKEAHCRLGFADAAMGFLVFRCEGTLVDAACGQHRWSASFGGLVADPKIGASWRPRLEVPGWVSSSASPWAICAPDGKSLAVVAPTGPKASARCVDSARRALDIGRSAFAQARVEALEACARDRDPDEGPATEDDSPGLEEAVLAPESRALVHRVLARQRVLFGSLRLPPLCRSEGAGCVAGTDPNEAILGRIVARGCGAQVWAVQELSHGGMSDALWADAWADAEGRPLTRVPAGAPIHRPSAVLDWYDYAPAFAIGNTFRAGYVFHNAGQVGPGVQREADVIAEACWDRDSSAWDLCAAYAAGGRPTGNYEPADWNNVAKQVSADWPRASRRLARWQRELGSGLRLDPRNGEERRQICEPLLIDACTGDIAEVCALLTIDRAVRCDGQRLPGERCERFRFARLPMESALAKPSR
jgi:hypothetical protein